MIQRRQVPVVAGFRFVYGLRMVAPFAIGIARVRTLSFSALNACSGLVWSATFAGAGYVFGATLTSLFSDPLWRIAGVSFVIGIVVFVAVAFMRGGKYRRG